MFLHLVLAVIANYHRPSDLDNNHLFLTILEGEKSRMQVQVDLAFGERIPSGSQMMIFFLCPHTVESRR